MSSSNRVGHDNRRIIAYSLAELCLLEFLAKLDVIDEDMIYVSAKTFFSDL